jgi:hypothetical protein
LKAGLKAVQMVEMVERKVGQMGEIQVVLTVVLKVESKADELVVKMDEKGMRSAKLKAAQKGCMKVVKWAMLVDLMVELMVGLERN